MTTPMLRVIRRFALAKNIQIYSFKLLTRVLVIRLENSYCYLYLSKTFTYSCYWFCLSTMATSEVAHKQMLLSSVSGRCGNTSESKFLITPIDYRNDSLLSQCLGRLLCHIFGSVRWWYACHFGRRQLKSRSEHRPAPGLRSCLSGCPVVRCLDRFQIAYNMLTAVSYVGDNIHVTIHDLSITEKVLLQDNRNIRSAVGL